MHNQLNLSGFDVTLLLSLSPFKACGSVDYQEIVLGNGAQTYLQLREVSKIQSPVSTHDTPFPHTHSEKKLTVIVSIKLKLKICSI